MSWHGDEPLWGNSTHVGLHTVALQAAPARETPAAAPVAAKSRSTATPDLARWLAAILDLTSRLLESENIDAATHQLADELSMLLRADRVAIGLCNSSGSGCRLAATNGVAVVDRATPEARWLETRLEDCTTQRKSIVQAAPRAAGATFAAVWIAVPLVTRAGNIEVVCLVTWSDASSFEPTLVQLLEGAAEPMAAAIQACRRSSATRWLAKIRSAAASLGRRAWLSIALLVGASSIWPIADPLYCPCVVEPLARRYVTAPFAGVLMQVLVKPGERVSEGQLLARLDDRDLRSELAEVVAEQQRAAKSRDIQLAAGKIAESQIDKLEVDRLEQRRRLLEKRLTQVEVRSPTTGIVVQGDLERATGAPLTIGQSLFEIAPLDRVTIELLITDQDVSFASCGQQVKVTLDAHPWRSWQGELFELHPRAEIRNEQNVFVGQLTLDNADAALQPGMKGRATAYGATRPLGWVLLRNLALRVTRMFG